MASISTLNVNGLPYSIEDAEARQDAALAKTKALSAVQNVKIAGNNADYKVAGTGIVVLPVYPKVPTVSSDFNIGDASPVNSAAVRKALETLDIDSLVARVSELEEKIKKLEGNA